MPRARCAARFQLAMTSHDVPIAPTSGTRTWSCAVCAARRRTVRRAGVRGVFPVARAPVERAACVLLCVLCAHAADQHLDARCASQAGRRARLCGCALCSLLAASRGAAEVLATATEPVSLELVAAARDAQISEHPGLAALVARPRGGCAHA
eukprot:2389937-Prymnesium_polylepis.1